MLKKLKAYSAFRRELRELKTFHDSTLYSYEEVESIINFWKKNNLKFNNETDFGHSVKRPENFLIKRSSKIRRRKNLNEIVFVRMISVLEVFLVDLVKDAFLETKEPFKKQDHIFQLSQAEILSINSPSSFYNKIINKECRRLSSSGFTEIIKYYKKHFDIQLSGFAPGKSKMEEFHERRHLLVHRLGQTDGQYRLKYNTTKPTISISEEYLNECFDDLKSFGHMVHNQMLYQIRNHFKPKKRNKKIVHRSCTLKVEYENSDDINKMEFFQDNYEFWASDEFSIFADILDSKKTFDENTIEYNISGTYGQVRSYTRILKRVHKKEPFKVEITKDLNQDQNFKKNEVQVLDEELLDKIRNCLPKQPWETGIHKVVAKELNTSNKIVSTAIQVLIAQGDFKQQIDGKVIE